MRSYNVLILIPFAFKMMPRKQGESDADVLFRYVEEHFDAAENGISSFMFRSSSRRRRDKGSA